MSRNPEIRQSNIECLRIICMFMIVVAHSVTHGGYGVFPHSFNGVFALVATQGARIAVNVFVFISGYFSAGKSFSASKVRDFYIQVWTYSVLITVVLMLFGFIPASARTLLKAITPFASSQWWFATCYLLLLLIAPSLQIFIKYAEQRTFTLTLLSLFGCWSICPQFHLGSPGFSLFGWFIFVYLLGAYLRQYPLAILERIRQWHAWGALGAVCLATVLTYFLGGGYRILRENARFLYSELNMIPGILSAILLFFSFKNWKFGDHIAINKMAACMFGVYLLDDNPNIRCLIWQKWMTNETYIDSVIFPVRLILSCIIVFIIGMCIEFIRTQLTIKAIAYFEHGKIRNG